MPSIGPISNAPPWKPFARTLLDMGPAYYARLGELTGAVATDQLNLNPGTINATPTLGAPGLLLGGDPGTSMIFNGSSQKIQLSTGIDLTASSFTMLAMVNPSSVTGLRTIFGSAVGGYELKANAGALYLRCANVADQPGDLSALSIGTSYLVGVTYNIATHAAQFWKNGVSGALSASFTPAFVAGAKTNWIGVDPNTGDYWPGNIQEAAIFTRMLTAYEWSVLWTATGR